MEKATFDYRPCMNPGEFKYNVKQLAELMENYLKDDGHTSAKAINTGKKPTFWYPGNLKEFPRNQELKDWGFSFDGAATKEKDWLINNEGIFSKLLSHFTQIMRYKLSSM